ncbi:hypothetical protein BGZ60DRAFT_530983 [Tricladium varicosporioides]|nr:hypothetical protein BGZ60DRAFT_530983 [Hymenoscyphus varicosporioides]
MGLPPCPAKYLPSNPLLLNHRPTTSSTEIHESPKRHNVLNGRPNVPLSLDKHFFPANDAYTVTTHQGFEDGLLRDLNDLVSTTGAQHNTSPNSTFSTISYLTRHEHYIKRVDSLFDIQSLENEPTPSVIFQFPDCLQYHSSPSIASQNTSYQQSCGTSTQNVLIFGASCWSLDPAQSTVSPVPHNHLLSGRTTPRLRTISSKTVTSAIKSISGVQVYSPPNVTRVRHCRCPPPPLPMVPCA